MLPRLWEGLCCCHRGESALTQCKAQRKVGPLSAALPPIALRHHTLHPKFLGSCSFYGTLSDISFDCRISVRSSQFYVGLRSLQFSVILSVYVVFAHESHQEVVKTYWAWQGCRFQPMWFCVWHSWLLLHRSASLVLHSDPSGCTGSCTKLQIPLTQTEGTTHRGNVWKDFGETCLVSAPPVLVFFSGVTMVVWHWDATRALSQDREHSQENTVVGIAFCLPTACPQMRQGSAGFLLAGQGETTTMMVPLCKQDCVVSKPKAQSQILCILETVAETVPR